MTTPITADELALLSQADKPAGDSGGIFEGLSDEEILARQNPGGISDEELIAPLPPPATTRYSRTVGGNAGLNVLATLKFLVLVF